MVAGGVWSSSTDNGPAKVDHADRFQPAGCRLVEPGYDADGSLCARIAALGINAIVFAGDSLAANLMVDLREGFFGEMTSEERPFGRKSCWESRWANYYSAGRGPCHDGTACGGGLRISWREMSRPDNVSESPFPGERAFPGVARENAYKFLAEMPEERVAVILWFGIHYLVHPLSIMDPGGDLAHALRFLHSQPNKFPFVIALGPAGVSRGSDGKTPWNVQFSDVDSLSAALRSACLREDAHFLDVLELRKMRSEVVNAADHMHPDSLFNFYVLSMILTLLGVE